MSANIDRLEVLLGDLDVFEGLGTAARTRKAAAELDALGVFAPVRREPAAPVRPMTPGRARAMIELRIANALASMPPRAAHRTEIDVHVPIAALRALLDHSRENDHG